MQDHFYALNAHFIYMMPRYNIIILSVLIREPLSMPVNHCALLFQ